MAQVGSNTGGVDDIVQGQVGDQGRLLQEKRQRLANAASSTKDSDPRNENNVHAFLSVEGLAWLINPVGLVQVAAFSMLLPTLTWQRSIPRNGVVEE